MLILFPIGLRSMRFSVVAIGHGDFTRLYLVVLGCGFKHAGGQG